MKTVQGQKKNQRIGKAGVAVAVALIFTSTFSGDIQTFIEGGLAREEGKPEAAAVVQQAAPVVLAVPVNSNPTEPITLEPMESADSGEASESVPAPVVEREEKAPVISPPSPPVKPTPVAKANPAPKVAVKPREVAPPVPVLRAAPPQVVYQAGLPPVPTFSAPVADKPLKFSAPAKAVREMPRSEPKVESTQTTSPTQTPAAPAGVYSLNTAPSAQVVSAPVAPVTKQMPTVKTQAGDKAVLAMPDGTTRVVSVGDSVPGFGVVNKLTKNEVIFGANK